VIRYVDSAGWTWEVCELADRPAAPAPRTADAGPNAGPAGAIPLHPGIADRAPSPAADDPLARLDAPPGPGELYFFSRVGARKLRDYPPTWTQLSRTGLEALCDRAQDLAGVHGAGVT